MDKSKITQEISEATTQFIQSNIAKVKPLLRGHFHQAAFFFFLGACTMLIFSSKNQLSFIASVIYGVCVITLFGVSASYHRPTWGPAMRNKMKRLDHAAIFLLIAGTCTPVSLLGMDSEGGKHFLILIWTVTALGVLQTLFWLSAPRWLNGILYIVVGWLVTPYVPNIYNTLGFGKVLLLFIGGVIYSLGAVIYILKRPNPYPMVFGYHEIFHLFTIVAAIFHLVVVSQLVAGQ